MADKCIGKLTLDISDVEKKVQKINETLAQAGAGVKVDLSKNISDEVKKQLDKVLKEIEGYEKKISEASTKAANAIGQIGEGKVKDKSLKEAIANMREYYQWMAQAERARASGNMQNVGLFQANAAESIGKVTEELRKQAEQYKVVQKARTAYEAAQNTADAKASKVESKEIEDATKALIKYAEAKAKVKALEQEGKTDTKEYLEAAQATGRAFDALKEYSKETKEAAKGTAEYKQAMKDLAAMQERVTKDAAQRAQNNADAKQLATIKQHYIDLKDAIQNYNIAKKAGDSDGMAAQQNRIDGIMQEVAGIQQAVNASEMEASAKQKILNVIQQCTTAENKHNAAVISTAAATGDVAKKNTELESQLKNLATRMFSLMAVIRTINSLIQNTVEYVSEYSDKMNEIQIITGKNSEEINQLGETYRNIAESMSVSSLDMADAAIYFTRQGLAADEIETRLKNTTMYAKTANIEFETAAELITAVVNSMNLVEDQAEDGRNAAQRVADVFLAIGDNAATSGREIGEAMQKAGAAAGAFNMNFEWLASYIATVSETTRQEATSIGTAFNTLIARLHSIRTTGFNSEDETKINDIQKALNNVNVALLDQEGNWRDMTDIFQDVADQWDGLDGKTKSYIATTMAGVKQQNVFLALMEDLSKRTKDGSRAWELHSIAVESAGTASEKYAVYTDSVTAAQERLNVAQEKFYALLSANTVKDFYNGFAEFVTFITNGTSALGGMNLIIPVAVGLVLLLRNAYLSLSASVTAAGGAMAFLKTVMNTHPIMLAITVVTALATALTALGNIGETATQKLERLNNVISESRERASEYVGLQARVGDMFAGMDENGSNVNAVLNEHAGLLQKISGLSKQAKEAIEGLRTGAISQQAAMETLNSELDRFIKNEQLVQAIALMEKIGKVEQTVSEEFAADYVAHGYDFDDPDKIFDYIDEYSMEVYDYLHDAFKTLRKRTETDSEAWYQAGQATLQKFFEGMSAQEFLEAKANETIDEYLKILSLSMNDVETAVIRDQMAAIVFGEDGILSTDEYKNIETKLAEYMSKAISAGFDADKLISENELKAKVAEIKDEILGEIMDFSGVEGLGHEMWGELDIETLRTVQNLIKMGATIGEIETMMSQSGSVEEFAQSIGEMGKKAEEAGGLIEETATSVEEYAKKMKATQKDIDSLDEAIKTLESGGAIAFDDLMDLAAAHPEIMGVIGDIDALKAKLIELRGSGEANLHDAAEDMLLGMDIKDTPFAKHASDEVKTLQDYIRTLDEGTEEFNDATDWLEKATDDMADAAKKLDAASEAWLKTQANTARANAANNWAKNNNYIQQITGLQDALDTGGIKAAIDLWNTYDSTMQQSIAQTYPNLIIAISDANDAMQKADAESLKSAEETAARREELVREMADLVGQTNVDLANRPIIDASQMQAAGWDVEDGSISTILGTSYTGSVGPLEMQREVQISLTPITPDGEVLTPEQLDAYVDELLEDAMSESDLYEKDRARKNLLIGIDVDDEKLHELQEEFYDTKEAAGDASKETENLGKELHKASKFATAKYFKSTAKAIKDLDESTIDAAAAYDIFYKECDKVTKAYDEIGNAQAKLDKGTELAASDINSLADALGVSAKTVIEDFPGAVSMFEELRQAGQDAFNELNKEATMKILGISEADFSNIQNGMVAVQDSASQTIQMLVGLGQFKLEEREVKEGVELPIINSDGSVSYIKAATTGKYQFLVPTGNNPLGRYKGGGGGSNNKSGGGGGGGGGGGSSNSNSMTEVERALDRMSQTHDIYGAQQSFYQAQNKYYSQTGQLQGVIAYSQKEIEVLEAQNKTLEGNVKQIEAYMAAKQKEIAAMSTSDARYEEVADDLDKLQKAHQQYTQQLIDNKTAVEALNEAIDEQKKKIRQMEIDLRNLVAGAIKDREDKAADMLENEIEMEQTILDLITKRYEKERDEILETNQRKIDALEQEKDLLSQQLDLRKQMAEEEDKLAELAELEAQYQRISADPTRRKEALSIQKKIADLRDEIAWDTAEKEVEAQQESLDQQITSLEDYAEYVEEYYEDLFEHPKKLIEEMREILARSDEEILAWLKANDEEYLNSTENRQKQIEESWQDTLDAMRGEIETYWAEVESIIAQGDEAIIQFLKDNKKEYAEAGRLQAEAYVDEWKKQLEDLKKAKENVDTKDASNYQTIEKASGSGGSGGGGGSGGSGGNKSSGASSTGSWNVGWSAIQNKYIAFASKDGKYSTEEAAKTAAELKNAEARTVLSNVQRLANQKNNLGSTSTTPIVSKPAAKNSNVLPYATGGIADFTGLAWLDGTKDKPERILSPYQTMLFESMVEALESMSRISIPSMPNLGGFDLGGNNPVSVGDIIVNVDNLDTDDDYDELARKVSEILMERIGRTTVVGGLRINSF